MVINAFIFPGQGSQYVGMAKDVFEASSEVRDLYSVASEILEFDLPNICFAGPEDELKQTYITQPAIFVHSMAIFRFLEGKQTTPSAVAGHSLGEYSALCAAGVFTFENALRLVKLRGELMQKAGLQKEGAMAAIMGMDEKFVEQICHEASKNGVVCIANYNSPIQIVISGAPGSVKEAIELSKDKGARKVVPLVVSGAFHSPLMEFAVEGLSEALEATEILKPEIPVYSNVTAKAMKNPDDIRDLLLKQITSPVKWAQLMNNMIADGINNFYEIGPGSVLCGLLKRIDRKIASTPINSLETISAI